MIGGETPEEGGPGAGITVQELPKGVGKFATEIDKALLRRHIKQLYNNLKRSEASILAQLRTGIVRLNNYLYSINATETDQCACG
jgi:hypothetical protein